MRCLVILFLCCLLEQSIGRPQVHEETQEYYKDAEEAEYNDEDEETAPGDSPHEDEDTAVDEKFSEFKPDRRIEGQDEETADNDQEQPETNNKHDRYSETNNVNQFIHDSDDQEENGILRSQQVYIKDRDSSQPDENNDMINENSDNKQEHVSKLDKNKRNNNNAEHIGRFHFYNRFYNRPTAKDKESEDNPHDKFNYDDSNRDRRDASDTTNDGSNQDVKDKKDLKTFENEAEQAIIQKFIKKLNRKEVEELMNTLSDDKRALLAQIINNDETNLAMNLNKREITKKAGAVEENNFMNGVQSDSNTDIGSLANFNIGDASQNNNPSGVSTDTNVLSTKTGDNNISKASTDPDEEITEKSEIGAVTASFEYTTAKSENKREVHLNDLNTNESQDVSVSDLQDESYAGSQDEDMTQLMEDDAQLHYDYCSPQKREIKIESNEDLAEPMKSLQESFSNSNAYEDSGSNMVPLIRVKRRNKEHAVKKRAAAIMPESRIAYVPESEDADNDEGEFYDDGFFDRTANFAKSNSRLSDSQNRILKLNAEGNQGVFKCSNALNDDAGKDTLSIGSDTDSVLSGVEGVDEHLMFSGGSRKKRAADKNSKLEPADDLINKDMLTQPPRSTSVDSDGGPENYGVSYNGNEGFGLLSKSSEGELSRYKRIRRLKPRLANEAGSSSTDKTVN